MTANEVRSAFMDFFKHDKDHTYYHSSSVMPNNDPSLLFVNAGMCQVSSSRSGLLSILPSYA